MTQTPASMARALGANLVCSGHPSAVIAAGFTCDLLSEVIANAPAGALLITVLGHPNVVAVAVAADLPAVLVCQGRAIPPETRTAADREGIALLSTPMNAFDASVAVHRILGKTA